MCRSSPAQWRAYHHCFPCGAWCRYSGRNISPVRAKKTATPWTLTVPARKNSRIVSISKCCCDKTHDVSSYKILSRHISFYKHISFKNQYGRSRYQYIVYFVIFAASLYSYLTGPRNRMPLFSDNSDFFSFRRYDLIMYQV